MLANGDRRRGGFDGGPPRAAAPHARATKIQAVSTFAFRMSLPFMEQGGRVARRHVNTVAFVGNSHAQ
jgi:hypothetical protein